MNAIGFDNNKYIEFQSRKILERISSFGGKLYLEFGGKLFDDYHAARVLPGFQPDSKIRMLLNMKDEAEVIVVVSASAIEQNKIRGDLGISYDMDALRHIDAFTEIGISVGGVVITQYAHQPSVDAFIKRLNNLLDDLSTRLMPFTSRQAASLRPSSVAIHYNSDRLKSAVSTRNIYLTLFSHGRSHFLFSFELLKSKYSFLR